MNRFSKLLTLGVLSLGVTLSSCEKEESTKPNNTNNEQASILEDVKHGDLVPGQYIVVLKETSSVAKKSATFINYEASQDAMRAYASSLLSSKKSSEASLRRVYSSAIQGFSAKMDDATLESLKANPDVAYVQQDRFIRLQTNATEITESSSASKKATRYPWGVIRVNGGQTYTGSAKLFVIDTGIDLDHPDLNVNRSLSTGYYGRNGDDDHGHGTHCAGSAAAKSNGIDIGSWDIRGVAAGATVVAVKVFNSNGGGYLADAISGIDYVTAKANRGDVANMSFGFPRTTPGVDALDEAVLSLAAAGVQVAIAAGNDSRSAVNSVPARTNGTNIYTIASFAEGDVWSSFSNYGSPVDFIAPGSQIPSTYANGGYRYSSGTSMAAPHVAGILLWGNGINTDGTVIRGFKVATR